MFTIDTKQCNSCSRFVTQWTMLGDIKLPYCKVCMGRNPHVNKMKVYVETGCNTQKEGLRFRHTI